MEKFLFNMAVVTAVISSLVIIKIGYKFWLYNFTKEGRMAIDFAHALGGRLKAGNPIWFILFIISIIYIFSV